MFSTRSTALFFIVTAILSGCRGHIKNQGDHLLYSHGAIIRGDTTGKKIALVFTGDEFGDGAEFISGTLRKAEINASFFFTGNFYRNDDYERVITDLIDNGNYMGSHSDRHLLYCDWTNRDSLLVTKEQFVNDLTYSFAELRRFGIQKHEARFFLPPYEWYNDSIASWTGEAGLVLVNFSPGTRSNADYTFPEMQERYIDSKTIFNSIIDYGDKSPSGLNGFILLLHAGTDPRRTDKFYFFLPQLIDELKIRGYMLVRIDELLGN